MWIDGLVVWDGLVKKERWWGSVENKGTILNKNVIYSKFYYRKNKQKSDKFFEKIYIYINKNTQAVYDVFVYINDDFINKVQIASHSTGYLPLDLLLKLSDHCLMILLLL